MRACKFISSLLALWVSLLIVVGQPAYAADGFVVKNIEINGLQRIPASTVYSYLPIQKGEVLHSGQSGSIISTLYGTGFFEHISLAREGDTLIINVVERAIIGRLKISGNHVIPTDKLTTVMKNVNVAEGRVFNPAMLDKIRQSLLSQYYQLGRYNARVEVTVKPMTRNRVIVNIDISEGLVAVIRHINIVGNHEFSRRQLERQLTIATPGFLTLFTNEHHYSEEKINESVTQLRNFYLDHGFMRADVESAQSEITPNRKSIYVNIVVKEGAAYRVRSVDVQGDLVLPKTKLMSLIKIKPGDTFSRQAVVDTQRAITDALGDKGFIFAAVNLSPQIDDATKQADLIFEIKPGKRIYVHHINFTNNAKTNDQALRRELTQMEASVISNGQLEQSKRNLKLLPYIKEAEMSVTPIPGQDDQVDVNYNITEQSPAEANFSIGYSQLQHVLLSVGLDQKNFLGTGNILGLTASTSRFQQQYALNYTNPYYTVDGISRTFSLSATKFNPANANLATGYSVDEYGAAVIYGIPLGQEKDVVTIASLGYGYQGSLIKLGNSSNQPSIQANDFVTQHGRQFQQLNLIAGLSRDSRDKNIFPTRGMRQAVSLNVFMPLTASSLSYFSSDYSFKGYLPLVAGFIGTGKVELGYGSARGGAVNYPFFKNYYAGGIASVRGYQGNTLGPKDSNTRPTGGNAVVIAGLGLVIPTNLGTLMPAYVSENMRLTTFVDAGNAYNTFDNRQFGGSASGSLRYSAGISIDWLTPLGPVVDVSVAKPLNVYVNRTDRAWSDQQEIFQFSLGANFG